MTKMNKNDLLMQKIITLWATNMVDFLSPRGQLL